MTFRQKPPSLTPIKVLVIEDDRPQRWVLVSQLEEEPDILCLEAADGPEGLRKAWAEKPDVILLDLVLPGMGGLEVLRRYKAGHGPAEVIVLSPTNRRQVDDLAYSFGAALYLPKPCNVPELLPYIRAFGAGPDRKYELLMLEMKANPRRKGFPQAARCAALLSQNRKELMKVIYLQAARVFHATPGQLDVNIRRVIDDMHEAKTPLYRQIVPFPDAGDPPSNKEFLLLLVEAATIPL